MKHDLPIYPNHEQKVQIAKIFGCCRFVYNQALAYLLLDEKNELHNRAMHISGVFVDTSKTDIQNGKANIENEKANIQWRLANIDEEFKNKTISHVLTLYDECGKEKIFGRTIVEKVTGLKSTRASELLKILSENHLIESVQGYGKGKYRFL